MNGPPTTPPDPLTGALAGFVNDTLGHAQVLASAPGRAADLVPAVELGWSAAVRRGFGFGQVYRHQAEAYRALEAGQHLILTTPTASGKTGAVFPALFSRLEREERATALLVYPLVALGQDQRDKLRDFAHAGGFSFGLGAFQGGASAGEVFAPGTRLVTATPDKLHWALTRPELRRFLAGLSHLVLDEAHTYRGGFGSEVAGMLGRLLGLAHGLGARPQVSVLSATIGNPREFAEGLTGLDLSGAALIERSGAQAHPKHHVLADHQGQPRRFWDSVLLSAARRGLKVLAFFRGRSRAARLYHTYHATQPGFVHLYMAGASEREARLSAFRSSRSGVMFATNALEAGVDIGDLDVVIVDGFPGTRMTFRQMAGRAGRAGPGLVLFMPALSEQGLPLPFDAFYSSPENFHELLHGPLERAAIEPDNPFVRPRHQQRAETERFLAGLGGRVQPTPYWGLRGEVRGRFFVVEEGAFAELGPAAFERALESPSEHHAHAEKHPDALIGIEGEGYRVTEWKATPGGTAIVVRREHTGDLSTRGVFQTVVRPGKMGAWARRGPLIWRSGPVQVQRRYTGYMLLRQEFIRSCTRCDRPPQLHERTCPCGGRVQDRMQDHRLSQQEYPEAVLTEPLHTAALEIGIDPGALPPGQAAAAAHTLANVLTKVLPERVACDHGDLGVAFRPERGHYFFVYDDWQGGLGIARRAEEGLLALLERAHALCARTCCEHGCYRCVAVARDVSPYLEGGERRAESKAAAREVLALALAAAPGRAKGTLPLPTAPEASPLPVAAPPPPTPAAAGDGWERRARELIDLRGLSLTEVSAELGVPSREIVRRLGGSPTRVRHARFGEGMFLSGSKRGEAREVFIHFPSVGKKTLLPTFAELEVL